MTVQEWSHLQDIARSALCLTYPQPKLNPDLDTAYVYGWMLSAQSSPFADTAAAARHILHTAKMDPSEVYHLVRTIAETGAAR